MPGLAQAVPQVAHAYDRAQRLERQRAVSAILRLWRRVDPADISRSFAVVAAPQMIAVANQAQTRVAERAATYIPEVLGAVGLDRAANVSPAFTIDTRQWVGTTGDGLTTEGLLYGGVTHAKSLIDIGMEPAAALVSSGKWLSGAFGAMLSDTSRGVESAATYSRPVSGYVRMLTPPSCGRCIILAGKWYRTNRGFDRHPGCDCIHIPAPEDVAGDMLTDPAAYLSSLDEKQLAKALGSKDNARVWTEFGQERPQAVANQLVNAYRKSGGIQTAQEYSRTVKYTTEGTTRRGVANYQMRQVRALSAESTLPGARYRSVTAPRLMPESIFKIAENQNHALRLLRDYGWLGIT